MDRFSWKYDNGLLKTGEILVTQQRGLRLYDGEDKVILIFVNLSWIMVNDRIFFFKLKFVSLA